MQQQYAVEAIKLSKYYGHYHAVRDISFCINQNEIIGFLGPNGAGKSSTMRILTGISRASSGKAFIFGHSVSKNPYEIRKLIGFMPENNPLPEDLRVNEYLSFRAKIKGVGAKEQKKRVDKVMSICHLNNKASKKIIGTLSKGFKQRVGIADAIISNPKLVIMDEPTIGLDPHQIISIRNLIADLKSQMSVIISSHILPEIELVSDKVMIMNQGSIVASGSSDELRQTFSQEHLCNITIKNFSQDIIEKMLLLNENFSLVNISKEDKDGFCVLKISSKEAFSTEIYDYLRANQTVKIKEMSLVKPNLEDIFMAATKSNWEITTDLKRNIK